MISKLWLSLVALVAALLLLEPQPLAQPRPEPPGPAQTMPPTTPPAVYTGAPNLEFFLASARRRARRVTIARADLDAALASVTRAQGSLAPSLAVTGSYTRNQYEAIVTVPPTPGNTTAGKVTISPFNQLDANVTLTVPIVDVTAWKRLSQARAAENLSRAGLRATEEDVLLSVVKVYVQAVAAQEKLRSAIRSEAASRDDLAYSVSRRSAGAATELTVDRSRLEVARAEQVTIEARRALAVALRALATLSGTPEASQVSPIPVELYPPGDEGSRVDTALKNRPEVLQQRAALIQAEGVESEQRYGFVPTLAFSATERFTNATGFAGHEASYVLALTLRWNFDFARYAGIKVAAAQTSAARGRLAQALDETRDGVHNARLDVVAGVGQVRATREAERVAINAAEIARVQFRLGAATQREVIDGERDRVRAEADRAQAEADLIYSRMALERASGHPLLGPNNAIPLARDRSSSMEKKP